MISGYWFMPGEETEWTPPDDLDAFMKKARADGKPLVYIGFGSIVVPHPAETTRAIIRAVERAGVRAIVAKGWSGRGNEVDKDGLPIEVPFPESCHSLEKVPHDWLFDRIDAAVHHGGAGTTGASLRAGLPTIIKPWCACLSSTTKVTLASTDWTLSRSWRPVLLGSAPTEARGWSQPPMWL